MPFAAIEPGEPRASRARGLAARTRKGDARAVRNSRLIPLQLLCVALLVGCQFGGWVPKGKHQPVAEEEREIADLPLATPVTGRLDCEGAGRCRVRHRVRVAGPGRLSVTVSGPRGERDGQGLSGSRLARAFLQDVDGKTVARNDPDDADGPMVVAGEVASGPYFVLVQGLGGAFEYTVEAEFLASGAATPGTTASSGVPGLEAPSRGGSPSNPRSPPGTAARSTPGDASDGADYAYDPAADRTAMRRFAFADDPQAQLEGAQPETHGNPFVVRQVQREIRYVLADRGIRQVDAAEADFLISVQVGSTSTTWYSIDDQTVATPYDAYFSAWTMAGGAIASHTYVDGTLVIDFIDPKTKKLVWHGWTTEPVNVNLDDEKLLRSAVEAVLKQFSQEG